MRWKLVDKITWGKSGGKWIISQLPPKAINRGGGEHIWSTTHSPTPIPHVVGEERKREREKEEKREEERESGKAREFLQNRVSAFSQRYFEMLYNIYHAQINI